MTDFEVLAQSGYTAFTKHAEPALRALRDANWQAPLPAWDDLAPEVQQCWLAVAQHMVAEVAALHFAQVSARHALIPSMAN
jgi:hypothetical protein